MRKEIFDLDNVAVGDKLNDNLSKKYFKVIGVSDNFIVAIQNMFGDNYYTIYSKNKAEYDYNLDKKNPSYRKGEYYRGPDNKYCAMAMNENTSIEDIAKYLNMFETKVNDLAISRRHCVALTHIYKLIK